MCKKILLIVGLLIFMHPVAGQSAAPEPVAVSVWVDDQCKGTEKDRYGLIYNDLIYLDSTYFRDILGLTITVEGDKVSLRQKELFSTFIIGQLSFTSMGFTLKLSAPPICIDNRAYLPLEVVDRATEYSAVYYPEIKRINIYTKENKLIMINVEKRKDREVSVLALRQPVSFESYRLERPDRIVVDLEGIDEGEPLCSVSPDHPFLKEIRTGRPREGVYRVVYDLKTPVGYKIIKPVENPNNLEVHFYNLLSGVEIVKEDGLTKLRINSTGAGEVKIEETQRPHRIVLDFPEMTSAVVKNTFAGDKEYIKEIKISQFSEEVTRVSLEMNSKAPWRLVEPDKSAARNWEIIFSRPLRQVKWEEAEDNCFLRISGEARLTPKFALRHNPERFVILLPDSYFTGNAPPNTPALVKKINISQASSNTTELELEMDYYAGHYLESSPDGRQLIIRLLATTLAGKLIVIDPGHGGQDTGTTQGILGLREKDINLEISLILAEFLRKAGARVELTRTEDKYVYNYDRPAFANNLNADLFLSVHTNSMGPDPQHSHVQGIEVIYCPGRPESKRLAELVQEQMVVWLERPSRRFIPEENFIVTRETKMPSVIAEIGFLSNREEESMIATPEYRVKAAEAMYMAILRFFRNEISVMFNPEGQVTTPPSQNNIDNK